MEQFVTISAAAKATGLSREFITANCCKKVGAIPHIEVSSKNSRKKARRLRLSALEDWLEKEMSAANATL